MPEFKILNPLVDCNLDLKLKKYVGYSFFHTAVCKGIDLGRTSINNEGLRRFKLGWWATEVIMKYYKYNYHANAFVSSDLLENSKYTRYMKIMPIRMLRFIGEITYKHIG